MQVTAVIVTFNRKDLLQRCIDSVANQTYPLNKILIVDNASTDGTIESLKSNGWLQNSRIQILRLEENMGGAGGFSIGWQNAIESGAEWLWVMDDDGFPAKDCLEKLIGIALQKNIQAISPLQVDIHDSTKPAFPSLDADGNWIVKLPHHPKSDNPFTPSHANLFNGLLIAKSVVIKIGLPRAELFIRGDEVEYKNRMLTNKVEFGTYSHALFYHPSDRNERHSILGGLGSARDANSDFKNYYMYRNKGLAFRENNLLWMLPFDAIRYVYYFILHKHGDFHGLKIWATAMYDGLRKKLGRHSNY